MKTLSPVLNDNDIKALADMAKIIWNEYYISILSKEQIKYMVENFQSENAIKEQIKNGYEYFFIKDGDEKCGYVALKKEETKLFISKIYILKEHRGKKLSSVSFRFIKEFAKENSLNEAYLTVNKNNESSINVYKHFGFITKKEEKTDIGCGFYMDDYVMHIKF